MLKDVYSQMDNTQLLAEYRHYTIKLNNKNLNPLKENKYTFEKDTIEAEIIGRFKHRGK